MTQAITGWTIEWRGQSWTEDDLTGQHLAALALISGDDRFEDLTITENEIRAYPGLGFMRAFSLLRCLVLIEAVKDVDDPVEADKIDDRVLEELRQASAAELLSSFRFTA